MAARSGQHLDLQAAAPCRDIDLGDQLFRRGGYAGGDQHGGQRGGAALVGVLGEEGDATQFVRGDLRPAVPVR